jgi:hypothetical protein
VLPSASSDLQAGLPIDAVHAFVVHAQTLSVDQRVEASVSESWAFGRVGLQTVEELDVRRIGMPLVAPRRRAEPDQPTGPS